MAAALKSIFDTHVANNHQFVNEAGHSVIRNIGGQVHTLQGPDHKKCTPQEMFARTSDYFGATYWSKKGGDFGAPTKFMLL
jgi:hypothetical protein